MIMIVDMSMLVHSFFHVGANPNTNSPDDPYDVGERVMRKGDDLRKWLLSTNQFKEMKFVAVFDQPRPRVLYRQWYFPQHKSGRTKHEGLDEAESATREAYEKNDQWHTITATYGLECDDIIASLAAQYDGKVVVYSADRDMHQCIEAERVMILKKCNVAMAGGFEPEWFTAKSLLEKHGVTPDQWARYQTMIGGKDDIPGWDGCGPKKAVEVLAFDDARIDLLDGDKRVKMNKTQRESYPQFSNDYEKILMVRTLRTEVRVEPFLKRLDGNPEA